MNERKIFGTDGIRGLANQFPIEPETALALGRAIAHVFKGKGGLRHRIVIGKDTRLSGYMLENALSAGICSMGGEAVFLGPMPTPGIAFITQAMRADAGVVISASHNPYFDNGIKFFCHQGYKLADEIELEMERLLQDPQLKKAPTTHEGIGRAYRVDDAVGRYIEHLKASFPKGLTLEGLKIVVDCANGAAYRIAPTVLEELGATVIALGVQPNGLNINLDCGALFPQNLQQKVLEVQADLGIALDGDADRIVVVDSRGQIVHGDALIGICAIELAAQKNLIRDTVVVTVMSNLGLEKSLLTRGIKVLRVPVGDRYVIEAIRQGGYSFGGEQSGHLIFHRHSTTGDGTLAALQLLAIMRERQISLCDLNQGMEIFPQVLLSVPVQKRLEFEEVPSLLHLRDEVSKSLGECGRLFMRYSGTESVLRILLEGENQEQIRRYAEDLRSEAEKVLGVKAS